MYMTLAVVTNSIKLSQICGSGTKKRVQMLQLPLDKTSITSWVLSINNLMYICICNVHALMYTHNNTKKKICTTQNLAQQDHSKSHTHHMPSLYPHHCRTHGTLSLKPPTGWVWCMYTHTHLSHTHTQTPQAYLHIIIRPQGSWAQSLWSAGCDVHTYTTHTHTHPHTQHTPLTHTHTQHRKPISTSSSDPWDLEPETPHWLGPAGLGCLPGTLPLGAGAPAVVLVDEEEHHQPRAQEGQHGQEGGVVWHDAAATAAQLHVWEAWLVLDAVDGQVEGVVALVDRHQGRGVQVDGHQLLRLVQVAGEGGETTMLSDRWRQPRRQQVPTNPK